MLSTIAKFFGLITVLITFSINTESSPSKLKNELFNKSVYDYHSLLVNKSNGINSSYKLSLNKFAGYNPHDFSKMHKGYKPSFYKSNLALLPDNTQQSVDWRNTSIVGPIKDQGQCGSCWAFSAVSALESQVMKLSDKSVSLSEQDMVDCVKNIKSPDGKSDCCYGCSGGEMYSVYQYLLSNQQGSDDTEKQYPYLAKDGECHYKKSLISDIVLTDYVSLPSKNEDALEKAVSHVGPISVGVDANTDWQLYKSGIYDPDKSSDGCSTDMNRQDHGVVVVGFGIENDLDYWIIRNSWNTNWGEKGYMRLIKGKNACGVANSAIYPIVKKSSA